MNALLVPLKVLLKQSADQYLFNAGPSQCPVPSDRSREAGANTLLLGLWLVNFAVGESSMVPRLDPRSSDQDGCHPACKLTCFLTPFTSWCYLKNTIVECAVHKKPLTPLPSHTPTRNHTKFCHFKVSCDGGGGALGHPRVYINLDDGQPKACIYCGLRYQLDPKAAAAAH